jgi:hypothetical protein
MKSRPKSLPDHLDRDDLEHIWREAKRRRCDKHDIQMTPVFNADYAVTGWECWACQAGRPPLTDAQRKANRRAREADERDWQNATGRYADDA